MVETEGTRNINEWLNTDGYLINPTSEVLREISRELSVDDENTLNIVVYDVDFRRIDRELTTGGRLVDLIDSDVVNFFSLEEEMQTNLLITPDVTGAVIRVGNDSFAVGSVDESIVTNSNSIAEELCETGEELRFRTPSLTSVENTLTKWFDESFYELFYDVIESMEDTIYENDDVVDTKFSTRWHIYASLVLAAAFKNKTLKEVSQCAEQADLTSRSTMSMVKRTIEEEGFIETEKAEAELGRPPVMLKPTGLYTGNEPSDLASKVYDEIKIRPERDRSVEGTGEQSVERSDEDVVADGEQEDDNSDGTEQLTESNAE